MGCRGWCCTGFVGAILSVVSFFVYKAYLFGQLYEINAFGMEKCTSIATPKPHQECEDLQPLPDGSMLMSCGSLIDVLRPLTPQYIPFYNYRTMAERIRTLPASKKGGIYRVSREDKYAKPVALKLSRYVHPDFHPHGISVVATGDDTFLYVVNHRRDGEFLSVFKLDLDQNEAQYWTSITSDAFRFVNNVAVDTSGNFYYSNWMTNDPGSWAGLIETFGDGKLSQVQYCAVPHDFLRKRPSKNVQATCETVVDQVHANGVSFNADFSKLFVVSGTHLLGYNVDPNTPTALTEYASINTIFPCDNVNPSASEKNIMYVGCFPRPMSLLFQAQFEQHANVAGMIRKVYIDEKRSELWKLDTNGTKISAVTSAIYSKGYTVAVSVFDDSRYMVCDDVHRMR